MKILIADKLSPNAVSALEAMDVEVDVQPELQSEELPDAIGDREVLIVRSTKVTRATIDAAPQLSLIVRAGAGVNTIDVAAASASGVYVANCPGQNADAVAELAIGLLIAADRRIADATLALREGRWEKKAFGDGRGLKGRTLGILGLGAIGRAVLQRAKGLEMQVLAWSRSLTEEKAETLGVKRASSPQEVARAADAVTVHVAAAPETRHLVDQAFLHAMKPGAILVNTSRGEVVDTARLEAAIREKGLRVALDVYEDEPAGGSAAFEARDLAAMITGTPHIAASTAQASEAIAAEAIRVVRCYQETGVPANPVNISAQTSATHNRVGVLAGVLDALREDGINIETMQNIIFVDGQAACCSLQLDASPSPDTLDAIRSSEGVIQAGLCPRTASRRQRQPGF